MNHIQPDLKSASGKFTVNFHTLFRGCLEKLDSDCSFLRLKHKLKHGPVSALSLGTWEVIHIGLVNSEWTFKQITTCCWQGQSMYVHGCYQLVCCNLVNQSNFISVFETVCKLLCCTKLLKLKSWSLDCGLHQCVHQCDYKCLGLSNMILYLSNYFMMFGGYWVVLEYAVGSVIIRARKGNVKWEGWTVCLM